MLGLSKWALLLVALSAIVVLALLWLLSKKLGKNLSSSRSWKSYLGGQGALLFIFLLLGGGLAWLSSALGPAQGKIRKGGQLIELREINPSEHPVYEDIDVEKFSEMTVMTRATAPENGSATVTIYLDQNGSAAAGQINSVDSVATSWSRWDQRNESKHLRLVVAPSNYAGAIPASKVNILVYLSPR
jgi:hypothetical protein